MAINPVGWSTTAASNTTVGGVSIAEGMSPSGVNNAMRAIMAGVAELIDAMGGAATSAGSSGTYTLTSGYSLSAYAAGMAFIFEANHTNSGAATLDVDGVGAKAIVRNDGSALSSGDITSGGHYIVVYESDGDDFNLLNPGVGIYALLDEDDFASNSASAVASQQSIKAYVDAQIIAPQGRLTVTTATPVITSSTTAQTTVYYTPYVGNVVPLYDGSTWTATTFSELSQALSDGTKSPSAATTSSNYDMFVWSDSGTVRCTRGPAWSSATARGTGAGTTELERINGIWVNKIAITNGPTAQNGTYVGTIRTNGSTQVDMMVGAPSAAAGGTANELGVWNAYNRVDVAAVSRDSTNSWNYTTATWRSANSSTSNRVSFVRGLDEDIIEAMYSVSAANATGGIDAIAGVGLDSTTAPSGIFTGLELVSAIDAAMKAEFSGYPGLGYHYVQALEFSEASGTTSWLGDQTSAGVAIQSGLRMRTRM